MLNKFKQKLYFPIILNKAQTVVKYLVPYLNKTQSLLDVGCGDMVITQYIDKKFKIKKIVGLDIVDTRVVNLPIKLYDGQKIPFPDNSFDTVSAIFALHHCDKEINILKEMIRVSRRQIIIIEEIYNNPIEKYYLFVHDWIGNHLEAWNVNIPFNFHTDREWKKIFKKSNSKLVKSMSINTFSPWLSPLLLTFTRANAYILTKTK